MNHKNRKGNRGSLHKNTGRVLCCSGFTLIEILTAIIIVTILVTLAVPLYEKTIERSHLAEARTILVKLQEAKLHTMDNMGCTTYDASKSNCPKIKHLNIGFVDVNNEGDTSFQTDDFYFSITPGGVSSSAVCARRRKGDYVGTVFVYDVANETNKMICQGDHCSDYGLSAVTGVSCNEN